MFGILDYLKLGAGVAAGLMLYHLYAVSYGYPAAANAATAQMVTKFERDAIASQLARERSLRRMADEAAAAADERASEAAKAQETASAEVERLRAEAEEDKDLSRPNQRDKEWLLKH